MNKIETTAPVSPPKDLEASFLGGYFTNPFKVGKSAEGNVIRLNVDIPEAEYNFLKLIRPSKGTLVTTISRLYIELIHALQLRGITDITHRARFEEFVMNMIVTQSPTFVPNQKQNVNNKLSNERTNLIPRTVANLAGSSTGGTSLHSSRSDDRVPTPGASSASPQPTNIQSDLPSTSKRKVSGKRGAKQ